MKFKLDDRLQQDSIFLACIGIFQIRLINDSRYPWLLIIPQINNVSEFDDMSFKQQITFLKVSKLVSQVLRKCYRPHKINIASLGNIVKQLHIHHVARFDCDNAWPGPIWGHGEAIPYTPEAMQQCVAELLLCIKQTAAELDGDDTILSSSIN